MSALDKVSVMSESPAEQDVAMVPGRTHYGPRYYRDGRIFSSAHQIDTVLSFEPESVLEIGAGGGMVTAALRSVSIDVTTVDVQPELEPDVIASVIDLPFDDGQFDVALCCQVLEHLPFDSFESAIKELLRVTRRGVILSLPDGSRGGFIAAKLPKIPAFRWNWRLPRLRPEPLPRSRFDESGHYWEIGYRGYPLRRILSAIYAASGKVEETWRVPELSWHRFFVLESG